MSYEPKGLRFFDKASGREMLHVTEEGDWCDWICYRHSDGQWVSMREATAEDREVIARALHDAQIGNDV